MKPICNAAVLLLAAIQSIVSSSLAANAGKDQIFGLTEAELITCAGFPVAQMQANGITFYKFEVTSEGGAAVPTGSIVVFGKRRNGCEATVGIQDGRVATVKTKRLNRSLPSILACRNLFTDCK